MKRSMILCAALALALPACDKKQSPEETTSTTGAASPAEPVAPTDKAGSPTTPDPATQTAAAAAAADTEDIPTEADFEEEAEQKITAANLEQELTTLEKEIGK